MPVNALQAGVTNLNLPQLIKQIIAEKKMINSRNIIQKRNLSLSNEMKKTSHYGRIFTSLNEFKLLKTQI